MFIFAVALPLQAKAVTLISFPDNMERRPELTSNSYA